MAPVRRAAAHDTNVIHKIGASVTGGHLWRNRVRSHRTISALVVWISKSSADSRTTRTRGVLSLASPIRRPLRHLGTNSDNRRIPIRCRLVGRLVVSTETVAPVGGNADIPNGFGSHMPGH